MEDTLKSPDSVSTDGMGPLTPDLASREEGSDDDIAERAAALLQGMRGADGAEDGDEAERRENVRRSRRRDNADEERKARRRRREKATSVSEPLGEGFTIPDIAETPASDDEKIAPPTTIVSPPTPEGSEKKPIELDD